MLDFKYADDFEPGLPLDAKPGAKVIFTGKNGYEGERVRAVKALEVGREYVLETFDVGRFDSRVTLEGVQGSFNSVHFRLK